jgi:hypothetical protein
VNRRHGQARSFGGALRRRNAAGETCGGMTVSRLLPPRWLGGEILSAQRGASNAAENDGHDG